ncbi:universal stress protein, partial [Pseudomonas sp.]|uniref:universal stress protein n=1 Tax=Pseudomonas sp. TaxID=306 RepID=UPI0028A759D4
TGDNWAPLDSAAARLAAAGYDVRQAIRHGEVVASLLAYQAEHSIDLLAMGAYGHSRIRQFLVGSTTGALLRASSGALLILR